MSPCRPILSVRYVSVGAVVLLAATMCLPEYSRAGSEAESAALDGSPAVVPSCTFEVMLSMMKGIETISGSMAAGICETITKSLGHRPQIRVLRAASMIASLMNIHGLQVSEREIAYQLMNIVEARRITNPDRILATFDTVWKIFDGTDGHVTPSDLNIMLRSSGPMARTLSDDGLISMGAVLWEQKKALGR